MINVGPLGLLKSLQLTAVVTPTERRKRTRKIKEKG